MGLNLSEEALSSLRRFYNSEIADAIVRGVTYGITLKSDSAKNADYLEIKQRLKDEGFGNSDILRVYELCNGYIFDMDIRMCQKMAVDLLRSTMSPDEKLSQNDILSLKDKPAERFREDMKKLADRCISELNQGYTEVDVALFSKNNTNKIQFNGRLESGKPMLFTYPAYCIRHTDIEELNRTYLIPKGAKISKIQLCEILPTKTGVRFKLWLERLDPRMKITR